MSESATPRTDSKRLKELNGCMATFKGGAVVYAQFARQLETELAAVTAERDAIAAENAQLKRYIQGSDNE